jgi:hypothetical protein
MTIWPWLRCSELKPPPLEPLKNACYLIARIDDYRLARLLRPEDRAVALKHPNWKGLNDHDVEYQLLSALDR